jgi:hypothetical protein
MDSRLTNNSSVWPRTHATAETGRIYSERLIDFLADWVTSS